MDLLITFHGQVIKTTESMDWNVSVRGNEFEKSESLRNEYFCSARDIYLKF